MNNEKEEPVEASIDAPKPQKVHLVKPPKKLNEMTDEERRAWAMALGEALKRKFPKKKIRTNHVR
jgi:hypothetical protein